MRSTAGRRRSFSVATASCAIVGGVLVATPDAIADAPRSTPAAAGQQRTAADLSAIVPFASFGPSDSLPTALSRGRQVVATVAVWLAPNASPATVVVRAFGEQQRCGRMTWVQPGSIGHFRCAVAVRGPVGGSFDLVASIRLAGRVEITKRYAHTIISAPHDRT